MRRMGASLRAVSPQVVWMSQPGVLKVLVLHHAQPAILIVLTVVGVLFVEWGNKGLGPTAAVTEANA